MNIEINNGQVENVVIFNTFGQEIQSVKYSKSSLQLDVSHLEKGVYLMKITDHSGATVVKRFVKQ